MYMHTQTHTERKRQTATLAARIIHRRSLGSSAFTRVPSKVICFILAHFIILFPFILYMTIPSLIPSIKYNISRKEKKRKNEYFYKYEEERGGM